MFFSYKNISLYLHEYDEIITIWGGYPGGWDSAGAGDEIRIKESLPDPVPTLP